MQLKIRRLTKSTVRKQPHEPDPGSLPQPPAFALEADIPRSSLMTILSRGVDGDSFDLMMQIGR